MAKDLTKASAFQKVLDVFLNTPAKPRKAKAKMKRSAKKKKPGK